MFGRIVRSMIGGAAALLLVQGAASAATMTVLATDIDGNLTVNSVVTSDSNGVNPTIAPVNDWFLLDFSGSDSGIFVTEFSRPPPVLFPDNPTLTVFAATLNVNGTDWDYDDAAALGSGTDFIVSNLLAGFYLINVDFGGTSDPYGYDFSVTATPLPPALIIFGTGLLGLGVLSRYRRRRQRQLGLLA